MSPDFDTTRTSAPVRREKERKRASKRMLAKRIIVEGRMSSRTFTSALLKPYPVHSSTRARNYLMRVRRKLLRLPYQDEDYVLADDAPRGVVFDSRNI